MTITTTAPLAELAELTHSVERELLPALRIESVSPKDPVVAHHVPHVPVPWRLLGAGNYAVVVVHPDFPELVVKVYAPGHPGAGG